MNFPLILHFFIQMFHLVYSSYAKMMQIPLILPTVSDNKVSPAPAAAGQRRITDTSYQTHDEYNTRE